MTPRENATAEILYFIDRFAPGSPNQEIYRKRLEAMNDDQFDQFMGRLESGEEVMALFLPNLGKHQIDIQRNYDIAAELGHEFFQYLDITDPETGQLSRTPIKHLVVDLRLRRQAQMLQKKMSIPENNTTIDDRSGQATGDSKGSRSSYPEMQINAAKGLPRSVEEHIKIRGGDERAYAAARQQLMTTGECSLAELSQTPTTVKANATMSHFLKAMMLDNNLLE